MLVYERTRSPLLAAVTFAASVIPVFIGGIFLAGLADRFPRRTVMISCDLARLALVAVMTVRGLPVAALVGLLFAVTLLGPPFSSARAGVYAEILVGDRYVIGTSVTLTTYQLAQVAGFAVGGALVALIGVRTTLAVDALTFAVSALISRLRVRARPAARSGVRRSTHRADIAAGLRLTGRLPGLRNPMLFGWLALFYNVPEGVAAPLAHSVGGGTSSVGLILAATALGAAAGGLVFTRLASPAKRLTWMRPLAIAACAALALFGLEPSLPFILIILFVSGIFDCYQAAASAAFVSAAPPESRSQVFGIAQAGMSLGQGAAMILAGAAAQAHPARVIAVSGVLGALVAAILPGVRQADD